MERGLYTIFHAIVGLPLGLAGLIGSIIWYQSLGSRGESVAGMYIGPVILGLFCFLIAIWSIVTILAFWRARNDIEEEIDI
jgi:hypothetical protein